MFSDSIIACKSTARNSTFKSLGIIRNHSKSLDKGIKEVCNQMIKKVLTTTLLVFVMLAAVVSNGTGLQAATKIKIKTLDGKYQEWYNLVYWIITPTEKDVFRRLTNNRERDSFINLFWKMRDPTKGTPENEFKEEHLKRFNYANKYFKYGSPLPGWKTDRGRIYILLGEPVHANEVFKNGLYPTLIWEYYGGAGTGLPTVFRVVFYKRYGAGDYQMYVPAVDGPISLLRTEIGSVDTNDYYDIYRRIHELEPTVAEIALTLIPGEGMQDYSPSLQDPILIGKIYDLPQNKINATYAKNFLNLKGIVETNVMTNYIGLKSDLYVIRDPLLKLNFIHFAVLPDRISVDYSPDRDKYYFNFNLMIILKKGDDVIFQYNKDFPFYYTKEELDSKLSHGMVITDYFPVIEGKYKMFAILQNSVNKELSYYEKTIYTDSKPTVKIYGPLLSYEHNPAKQLVYSAFNVVGQVIKIDPKRVFGQRDMINTYFSIDRGNKKGPLNVEMDVICLDERNPYKKTYTYQLTDGKQYELFHQTLEKLNYGNYDIKVRVVDPGNIVLKEAGKPLEISPVSIVPHPPLASKRMRQANSFFFYTVIANQYEKVNQIDKAEAYYEKALLMNNTYPELLKHYSALLLKLKKYDKMLQVIEGLKGQEKEMFNYFSFKGRAFYHKKLYGDALDTLLQANKIYDSDTAVLNALGLTLIQTDNKEEAIKALSASLRINDTQKDIAEVLAKLKADVKNQKGKKSKNMRKNSKKK